VPPFPEALNLVDGEPVAGDGDVLEVLFPVTGEVLARVRAAGQEQIEAAVGAARRTFDEGVWRRQPPPARARVLEAMAADLESRSADLATRVMFDNGKTAPEAAGDVQACGAALRAAARYCLAEETPSPPAERGVVKLVRREPVGVVAAVTPFNAPLVFAALKCGPALAAGNSVVLKPSERAPLVPIALGEAALRAGLPSGTLNIVHGRAEVAAALCSDPRVDMITITGGTRSGSAVMQAAARGIKRVLLELGGKSAHIVLADADLDRAIPGVAAGIYRNAGQRCFSGSRLVVEEAVADRVAEGVARIAEALVVGDPFEPGTHVGAMIDRAALEAVEAFVARARADGIEVAAGGERVRALEPGFFHRPTLLTGARADSYAAQEEVFGPVLTMIRVKDLDEAVAVANRTRYGLAGGVWTRSVDRALEVASRVRCGTFWVNTYGAIFGDVPFGGFGQSGLGREGGREGYNAYTELKTVLVDTTGGSTAPLFDLRGSSPG
jgi:acyl-CoA reductase-like NAD-dependent aldehyde dehydrogenase